MDTKSNIDVYPSKTSSFVDWIKIKPYWERYLWSLHMTKSELTETEINKCYRYLLEDNKVFKELPNRIFITFPDYNLDDTDLASDKITLDKVESLRNVNAIDNDCSIIFGKNLTIIYGDNGSGKSGIGRLLSNACFSRKPRRLLPNTRINTPPAEARATADFYVTDSNGSKVVNYIYGQNYPILKSFSVFDHECAQTHLNNENTVEFIPSKIKIFDEVFKSLIIIEKKLQDESSLRRRDNPTTGLFTDISQITTFLSSISYDTSDKVIDDFLTFTKIDEALLIEKNKNLAVAIKLDVAKQKKELKDECFDLDTFKNTLLNKVTIISYDKSVEINKIIKEIEIKKSIVNKLSLKNFDFAAFKNIGSPEWKALILAAQKLYERELASNHIIELEHCILCQQPLTSKEKTLFSGYWEFLKSTAESELALSRSILATHLRKLELEIINWPIFSETEIAVKIIKKDASDDLEKLIDTFNKLKTQILEWIENIKKEQNVTYLDYEINLDSITKLITTKRESETKLVDTTPIVSSLKRDIVCLEQKRQLSNILPKIKEYSVWLRWSNAIRNINISTIRGNITRKKTEIMSEIVISKYVDIFNEETEKLECNFGLKIESHGKDSNTVKGLKLDFAKGYNPSEILSEGEQTVSALADFITEAKLDKNNFGIIFDDPVTSLDHLRKTTIVKRLIEESKEKQVIVLTHDIGFLQELQSQAEDNSIDISCCTLERNGKKIGIVKNKFPWNVQKVKERINELKSQLPNMKTAEEGDHDEYREKIKTWYGKLYETWEATIEEKLLQKVIVRYTNEVHPKAIDDIEINEEIKKIIRDAMTNANNWRHDQGTAVNRGLPTNTKLELDIKIIEDFINKCKRD